MPDTKKKLLTIRNLKKYFPVGKESTFRAARQYVRANEDISIDIYEGETLGLVGESGCGKSTFGRVLLQLYSQTAGSTMYYGRSLYEVAPKYVSDTLKNVKKYLEKYHAAQKKADEANARCEGLGDSISHEQSNARDQAVFTAENALGDVAKVLGGLMLSPQVEQAAGLMLQHFEAGVSLYRLQQLPESDENRQQLIQKEQELAALEAELEQERQRCREQSGFDALEAMRDEGIDLARLQYGEIRRLRKDLQIIFQDPYSSLNPRLTIGQTIEEGLVTHKLYRKGAAETKSYILQVMRNCGLQDYMLHRFPHQFSGGQRQRICIARALAVRPKFVVCDECVSALDVSIQSQIINLLQELKEQQGLTYLFISHDLSVVKYISDRVGVMYLGSIVELADKQTIFHDPRHPYTVALLSSIPTTDPDSANKEHIILEGNIPSPINPPTGCKFHTRCYMATEKCSRICPQLQEIEPKHYVACHYPQRKLNEKGEYLFPLPKGGGKG